MNKKNSSTTANRQEKTHSNSDMCSEGETDADAASDDVDKKHNINCRVFVTTTATTTAISSTTFREFIWDIVQHCLLQNAIFMEMMILTTLDIDYLVDDDDAFDKELMICLEGFLRLCSKCVVVVTQLNNQQQQQSPTPSSSSALYSVVFIFLIINLFCGCNIVCSSSHQSSLIRVDIVVATAHQHLHYATVIVVSN
ncbi:hypothetical protein CVS40_8759 [Lucilia cuprina]|nr:hypothetical protein CVS40_8759 [Lucilia cuprina]